MILPVVTHHHETSATCMYVFFKKSFDGVTSLVDDPIYLKIWSEVNRPVFQLQATCPSEIWLSPSPPEARTENFPEIPIGFRKLEMLPEMPELQSSALPEENFNNSKLCQKINILILNNIL